MEAWEDRKYPIAIDGAAGGGAAIAAEIEIVAHRQVRENPPALGNVNEATGDNRRRLLTLNRGAVEQDRAATRTHDAGDGAVECRFADAVRAEHGDDLARLDFQIDAAQHVGVAIPGAQRANVEKRLRGR